MGGDGRVGWEGMGGKKGIFGIALKVEPNFVLKYYWAKNDSPLDSIFHPLK